MIVAENMMGNFDLFSYVASKAKRYSDLSLFFAISNQNASICDFILRFSCETWGKICDLEFVMCKRSDLRLQILGTLSVRLRFRVRVQAVKVPIFGAFPLENLTNKTAASKLFYPGHQTSLTTSPGKKIAPGRFLGSVRCFWAGCFSAFWGGGRLGVVSPHLPVGKKFLRFCLIWSA